MKLQMKYNKFRYLTQLMINKLRARPIKNTRSFMIIKVRLQMNNYKKEGKILKKRKKIVNKLYRS